MKKLLVLAAVSVVALGLSVGVASSTAATGSEATVTHYTASYSCTCFGTFTIVGVHITNKQFPGIDSGGGNATGGRDNFSGTVSEPPAVETVLNDANSGAWCSDYDGQCTSDWSLTIEPDGALTAWAVYPSS